jgi:hypothetical protein
MIDYFWRMGIKMIFLPAYCPFYNPIEILFGLVKRYCQKKEIKPGEEIHTLMEALNHYSYYDFTRTFGFCGYHTDGRFDPFINHDTVERLSGLDSIS